MKPSLRSFSNALSNASATHFIRADSFFPSKWATLYKRRFLFSFRFATQKFFLRKTRTKTRVKRGSPFIQRILIIVYLTFIYNIRKGVIHIKKKATKPRSKTNFNNPKVKNLIRHLEISENRLTKADILEIANKDILYQLKNEGYIKETEQNYYKATKKLTSKMEKDYNESFGRSSSKAHSKRVYESTKLLPKHIVAERNFKTGQELEKEFKRYQKSISYKKSYQERLTSLITTKDNLYEYHKQIQRSDLSNAVKLQEKIDYKSRNDELTRSISILKGNACFVPDYSFACTYEDSIAYCNYLKNYQSTLEENTKEYRMYQEAVSKISDILTMYLPEQFITWSIEIVTNSYASVDIERHRNYEVLTGQPVIYLL